MIDFVKFEVENPNISKLEVFNHLEFKTLVSTETGEFSNFKTAYYKGLKFTIIEPFIKNGIKPRVIIEGSLHKYWNSGKHNYNDFGEIGIWEVLEELNEKFGIHPEKCVLKQIELGLNIIIPYPTRKFLNHLLLHRAKRFKTIYVENEGEYIQAKYQQYIFKIYNKQKQYSKLGYDISDNILRVELKITRMSYLKRYHIKTLWELISLYDFAQCLYLVRREWQKVVLYDFEVLENDSTSFKFSNPNYWDGLSYGKLRYRRDKLSKIIAVNDGKMKENIDNLLVEKFKTIFPNSISVIQLP